MVVLRSLATLIAATLATAQGPVVVERLEDRCRVTIDGELFTEYRFAGVQNPVLYPVIGAVGRAMTRNFPLGRSTAEDGRDAEAHDHPHHRSLWFAHGDVNGHDFWHGLENGETIRHDRFVALRSGAVGEIHTHNTWLTGKGEPVCTDERRLRLWAEDGARFLDYEVTVHASEGPLTFGDTKEGTMAMRLAPGLRLRGKVAKGTAVNSEGVSGKAVWGRRARWVDYHGPLGGEVVGVAILDHPGNLRHPTWWHARDYGLVAANPFGIHDFEGRPEGTGKLELAKGESVRLRYRFYFHRGDAEAARVEQQWRAFAGRTPVKPSKGR